MTHPQFPPDVLKKIEGLDQLLKDIRATSTRPSLTVHHLPNDVLLRAKQSLDRAPAFRPHPLDAVMTAFLNREYPEVPTVSTATQRHPSLLDRIAERICQIRYFLFRLRHR